MLGNKNENILKKTSNYFAEFKNCDNFASHLRENAIRKEKQNKGV